MTVNLKILVPEATENLVQNPAFRYDTTGWTVQGATITRTLDYARFNIASGKVVTTGAALYEGVYYRVSSLSGISDVITISLYVRGDSNGQKVRLRLQDDPTGFEWLSEVVELETLRWKRISVTGRCTGGNDIRLKIETGDTVARAYTFYIDGAQMERKAYATTYCDGDQPGCRWNVVNHGSNSTRTADTREGGKWVALAGLCRPNNDIYVTVLGGLGMPPVTNNTQPWSQSPGSYFQNQKIKDRVVTLQFAVKHSDFSGNPQSLNALHELRQQIIDIIKTDKTLDDEAFLFEYSDTAGTRPLYMRMRYDAGLDGSWDVRNGWYNEFTLRLIAVDPLWVEDSQEAKQLCMKNTINSAVGAYMKKNGEWTKISNSLGTVIGVSVRCSAVAPDGTIYFAGNFTTPADINRICKWDGTTLTTIAPLGAPSLVYDMDVAPDGTLYIVGQFASVNGVAASNVAKYSPTTGIWSALSTGLLGGTPVGYAVCVANNGQVYVGGSFTTAGGVNCDYIARWDGLQWRTVGATSGFSSIVYALAKGLDGVTIYACGIFPSSSGGGVTYNNVASINTTSNLISAMGNGVSGLTAYCIAVSGDGEVYVGGGITGGPKIYKFTGSSAWVDMNFPGTYSSGNVRTLEFNKHGVLFAGGIFTYKGTSIVKYENGTWSNVELGVTASVDYIYDILAIPNGDLYVLGNISSPNYYPCVNTVTNPGTSSCWPLLYLRGQGTLRYIENTKTGQAIYLDLTVFSGEDVFIDFGRGKIESTTRGDLSYTILAGSEIRSIFLLPGENKIAVLVTGEVTPTMQIRWQPQHWSADSIMNAPDMV